MVLSVLMGYVSEKNIKSWVEKNLVDQDSSYPSFDLYIDWETRKSKFGIESILYSNEIRESFVLAIINGEMPASKFKYEAVMKAIEETSNSVDCYWLHVIQPDNSWVEVAKIWKHSWEYSQTFQLETIEQMPAAEGGVSNLCLLSSDKTWLLNHELNPGNDFSITLHSNSEFRISLFSKLHGDEVADVRDSSA